jgi:DNA-binding transcriptional LysR family regulator
MQPTVVQMLCSVHHPCAHSKERFGAWRVGLALFERHGRQVSLSTAGEYFLVHARRLLADLKQADDAMARFIMKSTQASRCACAWSATASNWWR